MIKNVLFLGLFFLLGSCDFIWKDQNKNTVLEKAPEQGITFEKDAKGCEISQGFRWSKINDKCIKIIEEGFRLNPVSDIGNYDPSKSAFVVFDDKNTVSEVYLPEIVDGIYLKKQNESKDFTNKNYRLSFQKEYILFRNDTIIYKAALAKNKPVIGSDEAEE